MRQKSIQEIWRESHPKSQAQVDDEASRSEGTWVDPMAPRDVDLEGPAPLSVAEQLGRQAERMFGESGRVDEWSHKQQPASASALADTLFGHLHNEPEPAPEPDTRPHSVDDFTRLYTEATDLYDNRPAAYAGYTLQQWRHHWANR